MRRGRSVRSCESAVFESYRWVAFWSAGVGQGKGVFMINDGAQCIQ